jgi:hypothetical protein
MTQLKELEFAELERLRRFLVEEILKFQIKSLEAYHVPESNGFCHLLDQKGQGRFSMSSTATCVLALVGTHHWEEGPWKDGAGLLASNLLKKHWKSGELPKNNPFTVAFVLDAVSSLQEIAPAIDKSPDDAGKINKAESLLIKSLNQKRSEDKPAGCVKLQKYPPTAYLTQLVVRVLNRRRKLMLEGEVLKWAWNELEHQLALLAAASRTAEIYSLAYSVILVASLEQHDRLNPDQRQLLGAGVDRIFEAQLPDGLWPRSRALFHYPNVGNAHCYEYEMLVQLLQVPALQPLLLLHLEQLSKSAYRLKDAAFLLDDGAYAWPSEHHPQLKGPESWSTASVYHFAHLLERLVAEAIRKALFECLHTAYTPPTKPRTKFKEFAPDFLDCPLSAKDKGSLKEVLFERFVEKVISEAPSVEKGVSMNKTTPISAILYGPPGTSKTDLAKHIASSLGWPLLAIDPSHVLRGGLDQIQSETNRIFQMLAVAERVVVLLDEFDEMVLERRKGQTETLSRFLTTAMLPKLTAISRHRRIVFLLATNHIDKFDFAIRRPGRFDLILQILPPTLDAKYRRWPEVKEILEGRKTDRLEWLTYQEFAAFVASIPKKLSGEELDEFIENACDRCTAAQAVGGETQEKVSEESTETWIKRCEQQTKYIRWQ